MQVPQTVVVEGRGAMQLVVCVCWDQEERTVVEAANIPDTTLRLHVIGVESTVLRSSIVPSTIVSVCFVSALTLHHGRLCAGTSPHWNTVGACHIELIVPFALKIRVKLRHCLFFVHELVHLTGWACSKSRLIQCLQTLLFSVLNQCRVVKDACDGLYYEGVLRPRSSQCAVVL